MKKLLAGISLCSLLSGCVQSPFVHVHPSEIKSVFSAKEQDVPVKQILSNSGYSALIIGSHEAFLQPEIHLPLQVYNNSTKQFEASQMVIRQPDAEREQRWQALATPRFTSFTTDFTLDPKIQKFDWQKPMSLTYIASPRIGQSLHYARNHPHSYDRVVIMQHGLQGALETLVEKDGQKIIAKIPASEIEKKYPPGSMKHLVKNDGYVLMVVCYGAAGDKSVAKVFANAFNRPVIASTTEVLNISFVLKPFAYMRQEKNKYQVAMNFPLDNELRGNFSVIYPHPTRPIQ